MFNRLNPLRSKKSGLIATIAVLGSMALTAPAALASSVFGPALAGTATPLPASFDRETYNYSTTQTTSNEANLYRVMVLQSTNASMVSQLKAANPNLKIFMYQDGFLGRSADAYGYTACSAYSQLQPSWFLLDQNGNHIQDKSYPGNYVMDVGNSAYEQTCAQHAINLAKAKGFDGIYLDDATANVYWAFPSGVSSPLYPTATAWQGAEGKFLTYMSSQIHSAGLKVIANIGGSAAYPSVWSTWTSKLDGSEEQAFTDMGSGVTAALWGWKTQLADAAWSEANGKIAILHSYNTSQTGNRYGLATMLLVGGGHDTYNTANANYNTYEMWYPEYTTAESLGSPMGAYTKLSNGVYERKFSNGIVLVNPTKNSVAAFSLGGPYSGSGYTSVRSVSMPAASGLVMTAG